MPSVSVLIGAGHMCPSETRAKKKEREKEPVPEFTSRFCKDIVGFCVIEAEEIRKHNEFFCH